MKGRTLKKKSAHRQGMLKGKKGVKEVGRKTSVTCSYKFSRRLKDTDVLHKITVDRGIRSRSLWKAMC